MTFARQRLLARAVLLGLTLLGVLWLLRLDYHDKVSTNVLDLLPTDEQAPELALVRSLISERQSRVILFVLQAGEKPVPPHAAQHFANTLLESQLYSDALVLGKPESNDALGKYLFEQRMALLFPSWLSRMEQQYATTGRPPAEFSAWLATQTVDALDRFLSSPESVAFQDLVPADPLLLTPSLAEKAQEFRIFSRPSSATLVWAVLAPSPFSEEGQKPAIDVVERASSELVNRVPGASVRWTGINRFAAESRLRIAAELSILNLASLAAVLAVACLFVRRLWKIFHLVPVVLLSVLGAWAVTTAVFERVHILVFVVGSLLTGVAIDYGFYLYMQPARVPGETYGSKLRRLLKPLLASCLTTVIGFAFLLLSELPLIRQLGVFVSAGLLSALASAMLYFAQLERAFLETRNLPRPETARWRLPIRILGTGVALAAAAGLFRLSWKDDVRDLDIPAPELRANDAQVRQLFGDTEGRTVYLTHGRSIEEARNHLDTFLAWHDSSHPTEPGASLAWLMPNPEEWQDLPRRLGRLTDFPDQFVRALQRAGYTADAFAPFLSAWRTMTHLPGQRPGYRALFQDVRGHLPGPLSSLAGESEGGAWFLTLANHPWDGAPPANTGTFAVSQLQTLNSLFSRYRGSALRLSAAGLSLVGASVFVLYGLRRGFRIFLIPSGSCLLAFGLLGVLGHPLNLFHLLGAFLGVCLSHNYAIFSAENARRGEAPPPSIRLSALTTAASFGVLAFSKIPVVAALGTIVSLIVLIALLSVELEPLAAAGQKPSPDR